MSGRGRGCAGCWSVVFDWYWPRCWSVVFDWYWVSPVSVVVAGVVSPCMPDGPYLPTILCVALLIFVGLPHGAVDHLYEMALFRRKRHYLVVYLLLYVASMIAFATAMWTWCFPMMVAFILLSAWHFGTSHHRTGSLRPFILGLSLIGGIIGLHSAQSLNTLSVLPIGGHDAQLLVSTVQYLSMVSLVAWVLTASADYAWHREAVIKPLLKEALLLIGVALSARGGLLWSFSSYFCLGHSVDAWIYGWKRLDHAQAVPHFLKYYQLAWIPTSFACLGAGLMVWAASKGHVDIGMILCVVLAGPVPHVVLECVQAASHYDKLVCNQGLEFVV